MFNNLDLDALKNYLEKYPKICITGATGWLGQEIAALLYCTLGQDFADRILLVASQESTIEFRGNKFRVIAWRDFLKKPKFDLLIHLAYLNQHHAYSLGFDQYVEINRRITSDILMAMSEASCKRVLLASSGAADFYQNDLLSTDPMKIYAALKSETERLFLEADTYEILTIMRIWNVTGECLKPSGQYAFASFISQALSKGRIELLGNPDSRRTYIDANELFYIYLLGGDIFHRIPIDSGGWNTTFKDLALEILSVCNLKQDNLDFVENFSISSNYSPDIFRFQQIQEKIGIVPSGIREQVINVVQALKGRKEFNSNIHRQ